MEDFLATASQFINTTSSHIFLTGKAGTGKTTFLKNLSKLTHKAHIVVAPTGIAALNAGGVTIHSQFLLPPVTFLPDRFLPEDFNESGRVINQNTLARKHPLNSARKQVLRSIDLLVIDEVSMLRADLLDAIDYRMKAARGNFRQSFGGAQVLFIGDLYQLPPVIRNE
jgi:ABC-type cobalamin/Fe3+-siderophores transport system ATPase subunit